MSIDNDIDAMQWEIEKSTYREGAFKGDPCPKCACKVYSVMECHGYAQAPIRHITRCENCHLGVKDAWMYSETARVFNREQREPDSIRILPYREGQEQSFTGQGPYPEFEAGEIIITGWN